jgi:1,4-alpha-glucan branching enzyme
MPERAAPPWSRLGDLDLHLFNEGRHDRLFDKLGAHPHRHGGRAGTSFAVWAPNAAAVSVIGDFNGWDPDRTPLTARAASGIWEGFVPDVGAGALYKYHIRSRHAGYRVDKADPFAFRSELPPGTASIVWPLDRHGWRDDAWMAQRAARNALDAPLSIYEVHLGSWQRRGASALPLAALAERLADWVADLGFTHVELMPVMEHPFDASWGYQVTGYFATAARYGRPEEVMHLIDVLHRRGIGVILDWVPAHFPSDEHGLSYFDGTHLYEHADPRQGVHPDWKSLIFNYDRNEVRSFLLSSARFWLERYHADGLRVDGVASMLYLDYSRAPGEWIPNAVGGRENTGAVSLLRELNVAVYRDHPDVQTIAEESTSWPLVSRPVDAGGLGFGLKWDMGWMHDTLRYLGRDPLLRAHHHSDLTFRALYAANENFVLPLSHDEVVHLKGSLLGKMHGDEWQKFAHLRLLFAYMFATPGKKLLFMGGEFGQRNEWSHERELDWDLLAHGSHRGVCDLVRDLCRLYRDEPALHERDCDPAGFAWLDVDDAQHSVIAFLRRGADPADCMAIALNFTPQPRHERRIGVPAGGRWCEVLNSDAASYGGSGLGNLGGVEARPQPCNGQPFSLRLTLPPLAAVFLQPPR